MSRIPELFWPTAWAALAVLPLVAATLAAIFWAARVRKLSNELVDSKHQLRQAHMRFGEALRSTHDLQRILELVMDIGFETVEAERGVLMLAANPGALCVKIARNLEQADFEIELGTGVLGFIGQTGVGVRMPNGQPQPRPDPAEPAFRSVVAAPLFSKNKVIGVLALYDKTEGRSFDQADFDALLARADQASVAIENVLLHQEAQRMAITDGLTSTWNHRYFQLQFEQELDRATRFGRPFSLILLDLDDFKKYNDTYGHLVGDFVLVEFAGRVNSVIRDADIFARYGGEEFVLILPETDAEGGKANAERIRRIISDTPFESEITPEPLHVTVSVGVACYPKAAKDRDSLFEAADRALRQAKAEGKNRVVAVD